MPKGFPSFDHLTLHPEDVIAAVRYLMALRRGEGSPDDIDHLGNRLVRTVTDLVAVRLREGLVRFRRVVQERLSSRKARDLTPRGAAGTKVVAAALADFFGQSELSQVVDQHNPLAQLQHERRLSALGPGGLNRKRAGFQVRDVHPSHYGRICPIETPEGPNIGLIASLSIFAGLDDYGFLTTPYQRVVDGRMTNEVAHLRADEEEGRLLTPATLHLNGGRAPEGASAPRSNPAGGEPVPRQEDPAPSGHEGAQTTPSVLARAADEFWPVAVNRVDFVDVSPKQLVGVSASLIPFLEHNDANRALMGSNMQRQAVPVTCPEQPLVATGMESVVARHSSMVVTATRDGVVTEVDATRVRVGEDLYPLKKFLCSNDGACLNQKPAVKPGQSVRRGDVIADGPATCRGEISLGRNVLVAFMIWDGYNFEDAMMVSDRLVREDLYTSVRIEEFEAEARETVLGHEEFTRDIPNVPEDALAHLDEEGVIGVGTTVRAGDILVGKVTPKSKSVLSPEEQLVRAIFGRAGEDVKNESLLTPPGVEGVVINVRKYARKAHLSEEQRRACRKHAAAIGARFDERIAEQYRRIMAALQPFAADPALPAFSALASVSVRALAADAQRFALDVRLIAPARRQEAAGLVSQYKERLADLLAQRERETRKARLGDELPGGVLEMVKVRVAVKRRLAVGDKMAGRHGNKGVISRIVPAEDMPFLADGTPVDVVLNPLGVPSRMNVGQIFEAHLGWAAKALGFRAISPVFDGADEDEIRQCLREAGLPEDGKATLYDGRTGECFAQKVTVGYTYLMRLDHLVEDKVHARATGPYSLITQQPLGGKSRKGGQRVGEMEVWALEAYGAAYALQEMLTVKSDDVAGREAMYEAMVRGSHSLRAGCPASFDVLRNEIRGLCLNFRTDRNAEEDRGPRTEH